MDDPYLAKTLEARITADPQLARTLVDHPRQTIEPPRPPSSGAMAALTALRALGASVGGRIDLHDTLGEGGMGVVHLATQATLGRHVAVKTLKPGVTSPEAALRILREAWVTGTLEHPNVVPVHDVGVDADGGARHRDEAHRGPRVGRPDARARRDRPSLRGHRPPRVEPADAARACATPCTSPTAAGSCTATSSPRT